MTNAIRTLGRMEWQATLLLVVVFGAGAAMGAALDHARRAPEGAASAPPPMRGRPRRLPPWLEQMDLTQDEHAKIKAILDAQRPKVDAVMNGILPKLQALSDSTFTQIRNVLTPDQQARFDRERPRRELAPGMPGGPGAPAGPEGRGEDGQRPPAARRGPAPPY